MKDNPIVQQFGSAGTTRRAALKSLGAGAMGLAGLGLLSRTAQASLRPGPRPGDINTDVLQFALNLEYLEAEYYLYATTGQGLPPQDINGAGNFGQTIVKPNPVVPFTDPLLQQYANEIAADEKAHVEYLRATLSSLGTTPVARPPLDLFNSFNTLAQAAGIGDSFDPFANETNFFLGAFIFEDVGVTAYRGAVPLLTNIDIIFAAAGVLGTEAYHAANVRAQILDLDGSAVSIARKISNLRDVLDGRGDDDQGVIFGGMANIAPTDSNGLVFARTARQVLNILYGARGANSGLFFPSGLNGAIS